MLDILKLYIVTLRTNIRDEDKKAISENSARISKRLAQEPLKSEPIAIVGYGPSLQDTWPLIKNFKAIMTTSGAHNFLIERGITPTYHVDCDPRPHKAKFTEKPQPGVQYLIGSSAHPKIVDNLINQ